MNIQDLLKMDMGECIEWLIENQYEYRLVSESVCKSLEEWHNDPEEG